MGNVVSPAVDIDALAALDASEIVSKVSEILGRPLSIQEELQIAMLSGAHRAGQGISVHTLDGRPPREVVFKAYLEALGVPLLNDNPL
ncbi:MAG: hypothetical protein V1809_00220 [Planctomycetota bacterium]